MRRGREPDQTLNTWRAARKCVSSAARHHTPNRPQPADRALDRADGRALMGLERWRSLGTGRGVMGQLRRVGAESEHRAPSAERAAV